MKTVRWLFAPADADVPRNHAVGAAAVRVLVGLLWLYNLSWKRPPDFGRDSGNSVYGYVNDAVDHPVFPPFSWVAEHVVLPNFTAFAWAVLIAETALAVLLLTGAYVRLAAVIGIVQSLAIGLSVATTPGEWPWSYWLMVGVHVVLLFSAAGSILAVDALRSRRLASDGRQLSLAWGAVVSIAAVVVLLRSVGDDAFAASGARLGGPDLSFGVGTYNLAGSVVLLVCGVALLAAGLTGARLLAAVAAVVGAAATVLLVVQVGYSDPVLGGTYTSAAFFLSAAVVGAAVGSAGRKSSVGGEHVPERQRA